MGLAAGVCWWFRVSLLQAYGRSLNVGGPLDHRVDVVYILGGGAETRPLLASAIVQAGLAERVLVPDPAPLPGTSASLPREAELIRGMLTSEGVDDNIIDVVSLRQMSTEGEVEALSEYVQTHSTQSVAVVTDDYHTRRCRRLLERTFGIASSVTIELVSCPTDGFDAENWWQREAGLTAYLLESAKLARECINNCW
ncbi:MAG: YdcF family protein [Planctomycetaceae bacterium]|nr:YdcF family protein [Planctomycetaceae bacterium]